MTNATIREAILAAIPSQTANYGESPKPEHVFLPAAHSKALRFEANLVVGARGVGKSFWTATLESTASRQVVDGASQDLKNVNPSVGYGLRPRLDFYPDEDTFGQLIKTGFEPYDIWRSVVVRWVRRLLRQENPDADWKGTVSWCTKNPEGIARLVEEASEQCKNQNSRGLLLFDSLDRTSNDWSQMDKNVRDLMRVVLWLKAYSSLAAKVFLREDQFDRTIANFPDASKLLSTKAELVWQPHDLHGLLWHYLINAPAPHGEVLRELYQSVLSETPLQSDVVWRLGENARRNETCQRQLFEKLAGAWMGKDRRRGVPYVWMISHLGDGNKNTSPRSFLEAIRSAAYDSGQRYPEHAYALHYESIKRGVQSASQIRIDELAEDYPWVRRLMEPLKGRTVPCEFSVFESQWIEKFPEGLVMSIDNRLPPQHAGRGWIGIREDLVRIGILETLRDDRVNMPDLFRVGFGLGRRGGVKPITQ